MSIKTNINFESGIIENAVLFYTKLKNPPLKYGSQTEREYTVDVVVDKSSAKAWNKQFGKQKAKEIDNADFTEQFKTDPVFPDQDEQFVIKLKKNAQYRDKTTGELVPLNEKYIPRVFIKNDEGVLEDITFTTNVGNGSVGVVQFDVNTNDFGTFAKLGAIRVDSLVAVEHKGGTNYDVLGTVKTLAEIPTAAKKESEPTQDVDEEENLPF